MQPNDLIPARDVLLDSMRSLGWAVAQSAVGPPVLGESPPALAVVTGSGLGALADAMETETALDFAALPGLAPETDASGVAGHALQWRIGRLGATPLHLIAGRRHLYEGIEPDQAAATTRLMAMVGVKLVLFTNAAGGLTRNLWPGELMLIRDHINLMFRNPLIGPNVWPEPTNPGPRFPDMCECYDPAAGAMLRRAAQESRIALHEGVYGAVLGPNYETRAEVEMLRRIGADVVGMSTAPEVIAARQAGLRVAAISLITNSHVNKKSESAATSHHEVIEEGKRAAEKIARLITAAAPRLARLATV